MAGADFLSTVDLNYDPATASTDEFLQQFLGKLRTFSEQAQQALTIGAVSPGAAGGATREDTTIGLAIQQASAERAIAQLSKPGGPLPHDAALAALQQSREQTAVTATRLGVTPPSEALIERAGKLLAESFTENAAANTQQAAATSRITEQLKERGRASDAATQADRVSALYVGKQGDLDPERLKAEQSAAAQRAAFSQKISLSALYGKEPGLGQVEHYAQAEAGGRPIGLLTGIRTEELFKQLDDLLEGYISDLRASLNEMRRSREVLERTKTEQLRIATADDELGKATADLAVILRQRQQIEELAAIKARTAAGLQEGDARVGIARKVYAAGVNQEQLAQVSPEDLHQISRGKEDRERFIREVQLGTQQNAADRAQIGELMVVRSANIAELRRGLVEQATAGSNVRTPIGARYVEAQAQSGVAGQQLNALVAARMEQIMAEGNEAFNGLIAITKDLARVRKDEVRLAEEQLRLERANNVGEANAELTAVINRRKIAEETNAIRAERAAGIAGPAGQLIVERRVSGAERSSAALESAQQEQLQTISDGNEDRRRFSTQTQLLTKRTETDVQNEALLSFQKREYAGDIARARRALELSGAQQPGVFQRLQAYIAGRAGQPDRQASDFLNLPQFLTSRLLTTGGFALSGAVLYGGVQGIKDLIKEGTELQKQLVLIRSQYEELGRTTEGFDAQAHFEKTRADILELARTTNTAADEVALLQRRLAGAFATPAGLPDTERATRELGDALKLSTITGLPEKEITDSLTAIALSFNTNFKEIGDSALGLEQTFGVGSTEIIQFAADIAPIASQLGFTATQIEAVGAVAQQVSGKTGSALAEQFGRILPGLIEQGASLLQIFQNNTATLGQVDTLAEALAKRDLPGVLTQIAEGYNKLAPAQQNAILALVGERQAGTFAAVLQRPEALTRGLGSATEDFAGTTEARFKQVAETVSFAFGQMKRTFEQLGIELFQAGIADALKGIADAGKQIADVMLIVVEVFKTFNDILGGLPAKVIAVALAIRGLTVAYGALRTGAAAVTGVNLAAGVGGLTAIGGLASPFRNQPFPAGQAGSWGIGSQPERRAFSPPPAFLTGLGVSEGASSAISGVIASVAPILAGLAISGLLAYVSKVNGQMAAAQKDLDEKVADAIKKGVTPESIRQAAAAEGGFSAREQLSRYLPGGPSSKTFSQAVEDSIQKAQEDQKERILKALSGAGLKQIDLSKLQEASGIRPDEIQAALGAGELDLRGSGGGITGQVDVLDIAERLRKNPTNDRLREVIDAIIKQAKETNPALAAAIELIIQGDKDLAKTLQLADEASKTLDKASLSLEEAQAGLATGTTTIPEYLAAQRRLASGLATMIAAGRAQGNDVSQLVGQLNQINQQNNSIITAAITRTEAITNRIAAAVGADVPQVSLGSARTKLVSTLTNIYSTTDQNLDAAIGVVEAQRAVFEAYVNSATTAAEKLARLNAGFKIDPLARAVIVQQELKFSQNQVVLQAAAAVLHTSVEELGKIVVAGILTSANGGQEALRAALTAQRDELLIAIEAIANAQGSISQINALYGELAKVNEALANIGNLVVFDPGGTGGGTPEEKAAAQKAAADEAKAAADKANQEAKAAAEAALAVQQALAHGDPIRIAEIAIQIGYVEARFATTQSERLQAEAAIINAQNQLADAIAAAVQAEYQLLEQQVSHDAVAVAKLKVAAAQAAATAAAGQGRAAVAQAQAALLQAQEALQDAVFAAFTAQQDLLVAIANAAGDTVEAARIQLAIAQEKLAEIISKGGGSAEIAAAQAEVVQAEASLRDAKLAAAEHDIDIALELGRITVAQAIGQLEALLQIPKLTAEETNQILLKIKQLKDQLSSDLSFNLPSELTPGLYEVRRLNQTQAGGYYQDNRSETTVNDQRSFSFTITGGDTQEVVDKTLQYIQDTLDAPPRDGAYAGFIS